MARSGSWRDTRVRKVLLNGAKHGDDRAGSTKIAHPVSGLANELRSAVHEFLKRHAEPAALGRMTHRGQLADQAHLGVC